MGRSHFSILVLHRIGEIWLEMPTIGKFKNARACAYSACACWCSACAWLQNSVFGGWHLPLYILHKIGDFWLEMSNRSNSKNKIGCLDFLDPNIQLLEGVIFLYKLLENMWYLARDASHRKIWNLVGALGIIKSSFGRVSLFLKYYSQKCVISGSKCPTSENPKICLCLLVLKLCLLLLSLCSVP